MGTSPSPSTRSGGQRSGSGRGGSLTTTSPPGRTSGAAARSVDTGRGKAASNDRVGAARATFGEGGRVGGEHLDAVGEGEPGHETPKVIGTARAAVDEHHPEVGPRPGDHEARDSTAAAQIDDGSGDLGEGEDEAGGVLDHVGDGAVPEHAQPLRFGERGGQLGVAGDVMRR